MLRSAEIVQATPAGTAACVGRKSNTASSVPLFATTRSKLAPAQDVCAGMTGIGAGPEKAVMGWLSVSALVVLSAACVVVVVVVVV